MDNLDHIQFHESLTTEQRAIIMEQGELCGVFPSEEEALAQIFINRPYGWYVTATDNATGKYLLFRRAIPEMGIKAA